MRLIFILLYISIYSYTFAQDYINTNILDINSNIIANNTNQNSNNNNINIDFSLSIYIQSNDAQFEHFQDHFATNVLNYRKEKPYSISQNDNYGFDISIMIPLSEYFKLQFGADYYSYNSSFDFFYHIIDRQELVYEVKSKNFIPCIGLKFYTNNNNRKSLFFSYRIGYKSRNLESQLTITDLDLLNSNIPEYAVSIEKDILIDNSNEMIHYFTFGYRYKSIELKLSYIPQMYELEEIHDDIYAVKGKIFSVVVDQIRFGIAIIL